MTQTLQEIYNPNIFAVEDMPSAMRIILTVEGVSTEERWRIETPYVADLIGEAIHITPYSVLIDHGCGIGRISKELIARHGCRVVGVDISASMRALAVTYVQSDRFFACAPMMLDALSERGWAADAAISIWVLQHCLTPAEDIARLRYALREEGQLFVLNNDYRAVPTVQGWTNDGIDVKALLCEQFAMQTQGRPAPEKTSESISKATFWASFRQRY